MHDWRWCNDGRRGVHWYRLVCCLSRELPLTICECFAQHTHLIKEAIELYFEDADPSAYREVEEVLIGESLVGA